jgi:HPt (histidine-containing phosphotransfer) domain-containing protein
MTHREASAQSLLDHTSNLASADVGSHSSQDGPKRGGIRLNSVIHDLDDLSSTLSQVFIHVAGKGDFSLEDARAIVCALRHVVSVPMSSRVALKDPAWVNDLSKIDAAISDGQAFSQFASEINTEFRAEAWTFDTTPLLEALQASKQSLLYRFTKPHRTARADLRAICRRQPPKQYGDCIELVEKLKRAQTTHRRFVEQGAFLASVLGPVWNEFETDWAEAMALSKWTHAALSLLGKERLVEMAARSEDLGLVQTYTNSLEAIIQKIATGLVGVIDYDPSSCNPATFHKMPVPALRQLLTESQPPIASG